MRPVLIVDDEPLVRITLRSTVDWPRWGFTCAAEASNGEEALAWLREHPETALVILDLVMPRMGGLELLRKLREGGQMPQVIVLTAHHEFEMVREAFKLGATDYLLKSELEPERLSPLLEAAGKRAERFAGSSETSGYAVALKQEALHLLLESDRHPALHDELSARGVRLGAVLRLGLLTLRDFEVVAARYDASVRSSFPAGLIAVVEQVLERNASKGILAHVLHVSDDEYVLFLSFAERHGAGRIAEASDALAADIIRALADYMNVGAKVAWSDVSDSAAGPGPASLYRALAAGRQRPSRIVERAQRLIRGSFSDADLHLEGLSAVLGVTPNHLSACFTRESGRSFREYVAFVRVEAAKRLLAGSPLKVWEVAEKVGFASVEHFSRVFKKLTGIAPHLFTREPRP
jgi:two-component system response regulator YesN